MAQSVVPQIDALIDQIASVDSDPINGNVKTIGTHHGSFHCDEVLACYMLSNHTKEYRNAKIIRSRNPEILETADIVVDVGAVFDVEAKKFDHHQSTFHETFSSDFETRLSSAGLVYKYFGKEIISDIVENHADCIQTNGGDQKSDGLDEETLSTLYAKVYESFMEGIDGVDNGITQYDTDKEALYQIRTDLSSRVGRFNPKWNQDVNDDIAMEQFQKAMEYAGKELVEEVIYKYKCWLPARNIVESAVKERFKVDPSGQILKLNQYCPWIQHFFDIHEVTPIEPMPLYALFQDTKGGWRIRAVPVAPGSFDNVKPLPKPWCGIRGEELSKLCGIEKCVFVHASGFIGGNETYEGALEMAVKAVEFE